MNCIVFWWLYLFVSLLFHFTYTKKIILSQKNSNYQSYFFCSFFHVSIVFVFCFFFFVFQHQKVYNSMENTSAVRRLMYLCQYMCVCVLMLFHTNSLIKKICLLLRILSILFISLLSKLHYTKYCYRFRLQKQN